MLSKATLKIAGELLDRFFRDAEGKTNRQLDVYFTLEDLDLGQDRAAPAIEYLVSRGLIVLYGADVAFMTDKGIQVAIDEVDLAALPKEIRAFSDAPHVPVPSGASPPARNTPPALTPASTPARIPSAGPRTSRSGQPLASENGASGPSARPERATVTHIALDGEEFAVELAWVCTIGRSEGNTIRISDKRASKNHAEIRYEAGQFVLRDLESANGTLLNGEYVVKPVVLRHDDEVVIGRTMLLYTAPVVVPPPAEAPSPELGIASGPAARASEAGSAASQFRVIQGTPADPDRFTGAFHARDGGSSPGFVARPPTGEIPVPGAPTERPSVRPDRPRPPERSLEGPDLLGGPDLFSEPARHQTGDLFASPEEQDSLFASPPAHPDPHGFGDGPTRDIFDQAVPAPHPATAPADRGNLFAPASSVRPPAGAAHPPASDGDAMVLTPVADGLQNSLSPIDPIASLDDPQTPEWVHDTHAAPAPLLENQPVIRPAGMPDAMPDSHTLASPQSDDVATMMVSREDLFGRSERNDPADPPRWGDTDDIHPAFGAGSGEQRPATDSLRRLHAFSEDLPVADLGMASWQPPMAPASSEGTHDGLGERAATFFATLRMLRRRINQVDVPEKRALLDAVEVLTQHPYVRVVLETLD